MKRDYGSLIDYVCSSAKSVNQMKISRDTRIAYSIGLKNWTISSTNLSLP